MAKLALSIANRCVGRQLVFCQPQHLLRRVVRHASAVERKRVAVQAVRVGSLLAQCWQRFRQLRARCPSSCDLLLAMSALLLPDRHHHESQAERPAGAVGKRPAGGLSRFRQTATGRHRDVNRRGPAGGGANGSEARYRTRRSSSTSLERVAHGMERDHFMSAQEALEYGLIDEVIEHR